VSRISAASIQKHLNAACQCQAGVLREEYRIFDHKMLFRYDLPRSRHVTFLVPIEDLQCDPNELTRRYLDAVVDQARILLA